MSTYGEGERVFGPPQGSFDPDWVASTARQADPGLPPETAQRLAERCWAHLQDIGELDAPALARALMVDAPEVGATAANVVARAAVDFCTSYHADPSAG